MASANLKVVRDPLDGYEPLFLSTVQLFDGYWPQVEELLTPVVEEAMHGEMSTMDIYERVKAGQMVCLVVKDDTGEVPDVALALVLEVTVFPAKTLLNIVAVGGCQLDLLQSRFWRHVCSWAFMNGAREMQAMVSPAMARVNSRYGFKPVYTVMRMPLTEM